MRKILISILLGATLFLGGCPGTFGPIQGTKPVAEQTAQEKIQTGIRTADASIAAAERTLIDRVKAGLLEYDTGLKYHNKLVEAARYVDEANKYLKLGDLTNSDTQMTLARTLLGEVEKFIAEQAGVK